MDRFKEKLHNFLEYFGIRSKNYYHTEARISYDPGEPLAYYLDQSQRAAYPGPFDANGIPLYVTRTITDYLPVLICAYALGHLEIFRQKATEKNLSIFLKAAEWLVDRQNHEGAWLTNFPAEKFGLSEPFPSAIVQGLGISCLTRAFLVTSESTFLESAVRALALYRKDVRQGGVASREEGFVFYEEYPSIPCRHVLNGFIISLWGLYDLVRVGDDSEARRLYDEGVKTLIEWLPRFDLGYWTLYDIGEGLKNPAAVHYQRLHVLQLKVMHAMTGHQIFKSYYLRWNEYLQKPFNALRTMPAKVRWCLAKPPSRSE